MDLLGENKGLSTNRFMKLQEKKIKLSRQLVAFFKDFLIYQITNQKVIYDLPGP